MPSLSLLNGWLVVRAHVVELDINYQLMSILMSFDE
jgi:hypothetical protein